MINSTPQAFEAGALSGHIHSTKWASRVDGPGLRFVLLTQGCPLRCLYCHHPDCRYWADGQAVTVAQVMAVIQSRAAQLQASGGVTISGGEPLLQPQFVQAILSCCQGLGLHTALNTSGYCHLRLVESIWETVDLVLLDLKSFDPATYTTVTGVAIEPTLSLARYLDRIHKPTWIRFVLVPGLTDAPANVAGLADFVATLTNVERVEVLPFHKLGEAKWAQLGYDYQLQATQPPTLAEIQQVVDIFCHRNLLVVVG